MLTFSKDASPENAFFMQPEEESINQNVLFIHASVSLMKQYLREVASPEFGKSKERVAKVISMFQKMLDFLNMEGENYEEQGITALDSPFNLAENDSGNYKKREIQMR